MERRDFPIYGRKIFFLNPPLAIGNFVLDSLKKEQYEVYCVEQYGIIKSLLKDFPDAICFIFIDDQLTLRQWYNFIKSFEYDESLKSVFIGVISARIRSSDKDKFIMNLKLPCGFTMLGGPIVDVYNAIKGILTVNGAKGRRQYIRLDCTDVQNISGYISKDLRIYHFDVKLLSVAGFSCTLDIKNAFIFEKGIVCKDISLNINRKTVNCSGVVYDVRVKDNTAYVIVLFTKETGRSSRTSIRNFIYDILRDRMDLYIKNAKEDLTDYNIESFESPEANEILKNIGDLEEVPKDKNGEEKQGENEDEKSLGEEEKSDFDKSKSEQNSENTETEDKQQAEQKEETLSEEQKSENIIEEKSQEKTDESENKTESENKSATENK